MTIRPREARRSSRASEDVVVWVDHQTAVLIDAAPGAHPAVVTLGRERGESEPAFEARAVRELADAPHVTVTGPVDARIEFEREYVALTHSPDRLTDVEPRPGRRPDTGR